MKTKYYEISKGAVVKETEKAYLIKVQIAYKKVYLDTELWIPKSRTVIDGEKLKVEAWVIQKNEVTQAFLSHYCARHKAHNVKVFPYGY